MILMPMFDMPDASINENKRVFFVRHYANKLSGKYKYDNTREADAFLLPIMIHNYSNIILTVFQHL